MNLSKFSNVCSLFFTLFFRTVLELQQNWEDSIDFPYICSRAPHVHILPHYQHHSSEWYIFFLYITNGPALTHHNHPMSKVPLRVHFLSCTFYGYKSITIIHYRGFVLKILCVLPIHPPLQSHWYFYCFYSSAFSRSHIAGIINR